MLFSKYGLTVTCPADNTLKKRFNMAYKISDACVNCGACEGECPVGAISEQNGKREIDASVCVSCGTCAAACPTESIAEE